MQTADLTGAALNWVVAKCEGMEAHVYVETNGKLCFQSRQWCPSVDWAQGGAIIEREMFEHGFDVWQPRGEYHAFATYERGLPDSYMQGPTPLVAAMRCFVKSKLGPEVEIPDHLIAP